MKYTFVGDVHGKVDAVEAALARDGKKVFVGDFIDSFNRSIEDHKKCYDLVLEAHYKGEADLLYGNHELSYLVPYHRCSGYDADRAMLMRHYATRIEGAFKPYLLIEDNFLVSHAGLTKQLWDEHKLTLDSLTETLDKWWPDYNSPMHQIGAARGGPAVYGGMFWCDYREFEPVPELSQVLGHTPGMGIRTFDNRNWCIDALNWQKGKYEFLTMEL